LKKIVINLAKIVASILILGALAYKGWTSLTQDPAAYDQLVGEQKHWGLIAGALLVAVTAVLLTFVRWRMLVRALGMEFSLREAMRLGFVGYLFNFTLSIVGGDAVKAVAIAHGQPKRKAAAAATVVVDRIIGLYALFVVGAIASLFVDFTQLNAADPALVAGAKRVCEVTQILTVVGAVGFALVLLPGLTTLKMWDALARVPRVGSTLMSVLDSIRMYRRQPGMLAVALLMSLGVHSLYAVAIYLLSRGFPGEDPTLASNFIVAPISMVASAAPLPGGLGAFEVAFAFMYQALSPPGVHAVQGVVIALAFRAITLVIACIGAIYYVVDRRNVQTLLAEAKEEPVSRQMAA
jgi:uncharacterized membrane protein YbhN (UPF0104 family)